MTRGVLNNPLVSICLPTYNYAHYLPESISSCLNQTYEHIEIIITDDASTDNTREVVNSFDDPRIRFVENPERLGLVENWNKALSLARGEVVKFVFADDSLEETAVATMVAALRDPAVSIVFCSAKITDAQGRHTRTHQPYPESKHLPGRAEARRCVMEGNYIGAPTAVAFRAGALREVGTFNQYLRFQTDQEMWIRLLLHGDAYFISEPLVSTRAHDGSETSRLERTNQAEAETVKFINYCLQDGRIRALLSESDVAELIRRSESGAAWRAAAVPEPTLSRYAVRAKNSLRARLPRPLKEALRPVYRALVGSPAERDEVAEWERNGRPAPPPHAVKQRVLRQYAKQYGLRVLVETGTYMGEMVEAMKSHFDEIISIELSEQLFAEAKEKFAGDRHVRLIHGDSGKVLEGLMKELDAPALFWLDGHYSEGITAKGEKDTPILEELKHILNARPLNHVVIIDDARVFGSDPAYPTVEELKEFVGSKRERVVTVEDDSIRIVLRGGQNGPTLSGREI